MRSNRRDAPCVYTICIEDEEEESEECMLRNTCDEQLRDHIHRIPSS